MLEDKIDFQLVEQVLFEVVERVRKPQYHVDFIFRYSPLKKRLDKLCGQIEDIVRPVILEKMKHGIEDFPPGFFELMNRPLKNNKHFGYMDFLDNFLDLLVAVSTFISHKLVFLLHMRAVSLSNELLNNVYVRHTFCPLLGIRNNIFNNKLSCPHDGNASQN